MSGGSGSGRQTSPTVPAPSGAQSATMERLQQAANAYAIASAKSKENPTDANLNAERIRAFNNFISAALETGVLDQGTEAYKELAKIAPTLATNLSVYMQDLSKDGATKTLELIKALREADRAALQKEAYAAFDIRTQSPTQTVGLVSMLKAFAEVLNLFGVDTRAFVAKCDEKLEKAYAEMPQIDRGRIASARTDVSSAGARAEVRRGTAAAMDEIDDSLERTDRAVSAVLRAAGQTGLGATPGSKPLSIEEATRELEAFGRERGVRANWGKLIRDASNADGVNTNLSANDLIELQRRIEAALGKDKNQAAPAIDRLRREMAPEPVSP
jgi:hypothetical protein